MQERHSAIKPDIVYKDDLATTSLVRRTNLKAQTSRNSEVAL